MAFACGKVERRDERDTTRAARLKVYFGSPLITLRKSSIPHAGNV
jgi:hypothetical protein